MDGLPEDDVPEELLLIIHQENNDEIAEKKRELYLCHGREMNNENCGDNNVNESNGQELNDDVNGESGCVLKI